MSIKPDQLGAAIAESLQAFAESTDVALERGIARTAIEAAEVVKQNAMRLFNGSGAYAKDITATEVAKIHKKGISNFKAYVTAGDHYRVAHLLENGHANIRGGRVIGKDVEGRPHFAEGERYVDEHIVENIKKEMD